METLTPVLDATSEKFWNLVTPLAHEFAFGNALTEELNGWQKLSEATHGIGTPANALDTVAFAGGIYGINHLDSWKGIAIACSSFMADFVDGKIARATGTQSELGEAIDAGGDKVKLAYALYKMWQLELAPRPLLVAVAVQNGLNVGLTAIDRSANDKPVIHPSQFGKKAIFMEQWGLGLHVIGSELAKTNEKRGKAVKTAGTVLTLAGVAVGVAATTGYTKLLLSSRKKRK